MKSTKAAKILIAVLAICSLFTSVIVAQSVPLADSGDVFFLTSPAPNSTLSGNVTSIWRIFDDEQANVNYEMTLRDSGTCASLVGTIAAGQVSSNQVQDKSTAWSTSGPLMDLASVSDGNYCFRLCVSLMNGSTPYSACVQRGIKIRNHNNAPVITSNVPADLQILTTESWQYDVNATDANADPISFRLSTAPAFLSINGGNGLINTNGNSKSAGTYNVTVVAEDGFGGATSQSWQLVVSNPAGGSSSGGTGSSSGGTPAGNTAATITIMSPNSSSELLGEQNTISWQVSDPDGLSAITLLYADETKQWQQLASLAGNANTYTWDVSELADGSYYLQLEVTDNQGGKTSATSERFVVNNQAGSPGSDITSKPLIIDVKPEDTSETSEVRPLISGRFTPPLDSEIDTTSFKFFLDGVDKITVCEVDADGFTCTLETDLAPATHKARAEIKSADGQEAVREWVFTVTGANGVIDNGSSSDGGIVLAGRQISRQSLIWLAVICVLAAIALLIPWLLYVLWRRRLDEDDDYYPPADVVVNDQVVDPAGFGSYEDYYSAATGEQQPQVNVNYYTPEAAAADNYDPYAQIVEPQVVQSEVMAEPQFVEPEFVDSQVVTGEQPVVTQNVEVQPPDQNLIAPPDYMAYYKAPAAPEEPENKDGGQPSWLSPASASGGLGGGFGGGAPGAAPDPLAPAKPDEDPTNT